MTVKKEGNPAKGFPDMSKMIEQLRKNHIETTDTLYSNIQMNVGNYSWKSFKRK